MKLNNKIKRDKKLRKFKKENVELLLMKADKKIIHIYN